MWLVGRLAPDFKTLADFRAENTVAIKNVCRAFIVLCRRWKLFTEATVAQCLPLTLGVGFGLAASNNWRSYAAPI